jgi:demethylmenaquinone methyltransferase/2-methoxy-6-polyprenyl-1,4-benzoquinol methylase
MVSRWPAHKRVTGRLWGEPDINHLRIRRRVRSRKIEREEWERLERALESIIPSYERVNRILSLNLIESWWDVCARQVEGCASVLEQGCGTGCLSVRITSEGHVCTDPSAPMLRRTRERTRNSRRYVQCVAESLPFMDGSFEAVCSSFAFRDFRNKRLAFEEAHRVLEPGGSLVIAEISKTNRAGAALMFNYFRVAVPVVSRVVSSGSGRGEEGWPLLSETYARFGFVEEYERMMREVGFEDVTHRPMRGGLALLLTGSKP